MSFLQAPGAGASAAVEKVTISLTALTGSAERAEETIGKLKTLAMSATLAKYLSDVQSDWYEESELPGPNNIRVEVGFKPSYPQVPLTGHPPES